MQPVKIIPQSRLYADSDLQEKLILFYRGERSRRKPVLIEYANIVACPSIPKVAGSHYSFTARRLKLHLFAVKRSLGWQPFPIRS